MRTIGYILVVVLAGASVALADDAPTGWNLDFSGYSQERYDSKLDDLNNDRTRLKPSLTNKDNPCALYGEFDVAKAEDGRTALKESNWLQRAYVVCNIGKTKVSFGRLFDRAGYSAYVPGNIITARYPRSYHWQGYYAYGVDVSQSFGSWELGGMLSGASDLHFDDPGQFDRIEFAGRAKRSFGSRGHYSFVVQASDEFVHGGVDFRYNTGDFSFSGGVFHADNDPTPISALGQVEWKVTSVVALHGQFEERTNSHEVVTTGVGFRWRGFYFVGDYEYDFDADTRPGTLLVGARYNW